jgi:hypothetical protein
MEGASTKRRASASTPPPPHFVWSRSPTSWGRMTSRAERINKEKSKMRRKVSAADWRFPWRMTRKQWSLLPYPQRHAYVARAQCNLLGYFRDCKTRAAGARAAASSRNPATGIESLRCHPSNGRKPKSCASPSARFFPSARAKARKVVLMILSLRTRRRGAGTMLFLTLPWRGRVGAKRRGG